MTIVKFAIPKGSIEESTFKILEKSWTRVVRRERTYRVMLDDPQISVKMLRPQEIPNLVFDGLYDVGITGRDWVKETNSDVKILLDLEFGKIKLVIAIPDSYNFKSLDDMILAYAKKKKILRISSEYLTTASKFIMQCKNYKKLYGSKQPLIVTPWLRLGSNKNIQIFLSFGATEAKPPEDVDAIMDVTETGTTLTQNQLRIIDTVMESTAVLIANKTSLKNKSKREKIFDIVTMLRGAVEGKKHLHLFLNVKEENLKKLLQELPSLKRPTISPLSEKGWYGINTVIPKSEFHKLVPKLRKIAQGLVVHEPKQILALEEIKRDEES
ncbi:MAG: ATP phosphoribosyltransferase [Thaumarchaeota archaeon 13_1_40CM_38_12]|nr:MAG: ATP phosphoribosyltransferase [Thaumarchaeota archaeon 13_1_40CM_38_12]OLC36088.1 MAG: ATP phosphoribosyltransferase [Thaumarchaeota archaeon 13_1_40CM_4_38_7]OLC91919.1 MAG: ATP phosphoribosyltransferase [Thaumarchaeota archaeon 13_1_40CM_3_38_6]TLY07587.1 MAG: ATP phosphoribosyltransferase [Nitrososphaerota archaeon]